MDKSESQMGRAGLGAGRALKSIIVLYIDKAAEFN